MLSVTQIKFVKSSERPKKREGSWLASAWQRNSGPDVFARMQIAIFSESSYRSTRFIVYWLPFGAFTRLRSFPDIKRNARVVSCVELQQLMMKTERGNECELLQLSLMSKSKATKGDEIPFQP